MLRSLNTVMDCNLLHLSLTQRLSQMTITKYEPCLIGLCLLSYCVSGHDGSVEREIQSLCLSCVMTPDLRLSWKLGTCLHQWSVWAAWLR